MSKAAYGAVENASRKVKKLYGAMGGVTLKTKKGYNVVDGVARLFYSGVDPVLNNNDWATIAEISAAGQAANYWKIGDTKTDTLNGTTYTFRIIGFDHDKLSAYDSKYSDSSYNGGKKKAGITFEMAEIYGASLYVMNTSGVNDGGWGDSYMRNTVMNTMKGYMSTPLKNVLRRVAKLSSAGYYDTTIETNNDYLFLLSQMEVFGTYTDGAAGEGTQYAYYKAGNSRIKRYNGNAYMWWLRSNPTLVQSRSIFAGVNDGGVLGYGSASSYQGVSFCFCV